MFLLIKSFFFLRFTFLPVLSSVIVDVPDTDVAPDWLAAEVELFTPVSTKILSFMPPSHFVNIGIALK